MEKDFHYYITYSIAKMTGFQHADIIGFSCQFVDDNNESRFFDKDTMLPFPTKIGLNGGFFYPIMTQSFSPKSLDPYIHKYVYIPFHFLPGEKIKIDKKTNKYCTTPNSANANALVREALKSDDPYRIGIALHTFADTWSHQNFTGFRETWNSVYPWYNLKSIVPNIGHLEAGHAPDMISEVWTDHRLKDKTIVNKHRAYEALETIYLLLRSKSNKGPEWNDVKKDYEAIIDEKDYDKRIGKVSDFLKSNNKGPIPPYSDDDWTSKVLNRAKTKITAKNFSETHWFKFNRAAKAHLAFVVDLIKGL